MYLSIFTCNSYDFNHIQFAIGLALIKLDCKDAASEVIKFMGTYEDSYIKLCSDEGTNITAKRRNLLKMLSEKCNGDKIRTMLEYLDDESIRPIYASDSRKVKAAYNTTLLQLAHNEHPELTESVVYAETQKIMQDTASNMLLGKYIKTSVYKEIFIHDCRNYIINKLNYHNGSVSNAILDEEYEHFVEMASSYFLQGYYYETGTPIAYLRNAFTCYFVRTPQGRFLQILNSKSTTSILGGASNDKSILHYSALEQNTSNELFDFSDVATKICEASRILFEQKDTTVAFNDIFSYYRDSILENLVDTESTLFKKSLVGVTYTIQKSAVYAAAQNQQAIGNKAKARNEYASVFMPIVDKGLTLQEIHKYWEDALAITVRDDVSCNGKRLFDYGTLKVQSIYTNSQKLQIIINGFTALKQLIDYLKRPDTKATIYNFPEMIFRNSTYIKRFHTLEEYVEYYRDVSKLVNESKMTRVINGERVPDSMRLNDEIWNELGCDNLSNDQIFYKLINMPLAYTKRAVSKVKEGNYEVVLEHDLKSLWSILWSNGEEKFCDDLYDLCDSRNSLDDGKTKLLVNGNLASGNKLVLNN